MGCWNDTCAISNLPILSGDKVVFFLIHMNPHWNQRYPCEMITSPTGFWCPMTLPIRAKYNGYGFVDKIEEGPVADFALDFVREKIIVSTEDMQKAVDEICWEFVGEWLHNDCLKIKSDHRDEVVPVTMVMVHERVFDTMIATGAQSVVGRFTVDEARKGLTEYLNNFGELGFYSLSRCPSLFDADGSRQLWRRLTSLYVYAAFPGGVDPRTFDALWLGRQIAENKDIFEAFLKLVVFQRAMSNLRRCWHPMTGASQDEDYESYAALLSTMATILRIQDVIEDEE